MLEAAQTPNLAVRAERLMQDSTQSVVEARSASASPDASPPSSSGPGDSNSIYSHFREYHWAKATVSWLMAAVAGVLLLGLFFWAGAAVAWFRPNGMMVAQPSLQDAIRAELKNAFVPTRDPLEFFITSVLSAKSAVLRDGTTPRIKSIEGLVAPELLKRFQDSVDRNKTILIRNQVTQSLIVETIGNFIEASETGRVSVYVKGILQVSQQIGDHGATFKTLDYRARAVVETNEPTTANHQHFYLVGLEEKVGLAAVEWDKEQLIKK